MNRIRSTSASVVVVGGGFAGAACAKQLGERGVHVTLVDRNNYSQFQPLFYQVAAAQMGVVEVARPLREAFRRLETVDVKMAVVTQVDPVAKTVTCADGTTFSGDYLVLAAGSAPNFFDTPGAESYAHTLYALVDAERLRSRIFETFEDADRDPSLVDQGALHFVIVGAGATGVETAGALADLINEVMPARFHDLDVTRARVHVIDPEQVVLAPFSDRAHEYAAETLRDKGVQIELGVRVTEITPELVKLSDGREIRTRTVVWAGGIRASELSGHAGITQGHGGRLDVRLDLTVDGFPGLYALGDLANTPGPDGKPLPQLGSVALQAGRWAATNILADIDGKPRTPFRYRDKGIMAMIGRNAAIAEIGSRRRELHGVAAYAAWLGVHAWLLSGFRERMNALRSWGWDYVTKSRSPSIIDRPDDREHR